VTRVVRFDSYDVQDGAALQEVLEQAMMVLDQSSHEQTGTGCVSLLAARERPPKGFLQVAALYEGAG
jgi:hypothetical protein